MKTAAKRLLLRTQKNHGGTYIDTVISVFVVLFILAFVMAILPIFIKKYHLDMMANEISRCIAIFGATSGIDIEELEQDYGIELDSWNIEIDDDARTDASPDGGVRIQLADGFTVTIVSHQTVGIGGILANIDIPITSVAKGRSEVYWKELATED